MPITPSGQIRFSDLRTEFIGGSGQVPIGSLYRGGSNIRAKAPNNNGVNLAADVPTTGELQLSDYYGTAKGFKFEYSAGATDQDASNLFGNDYGVDYPKEIVIPSSVTLGTNNTSEYALEIDSGASGTLTVTNNGTIIGAGGSGGGAGGGNSGTGSAGSTGGDAIKIASACTFVNNGSILAGGGGAGGGGGGGVGGNLSQQTQVTGQEGPTSSFGSPSQKYWRTQGHVQNAPTSTVAQTEVHWGTAPNQSANIVNGPLPLGTVTKTVGQYTYGRGPFYVQSYNYDSSPPTVARTYRIYRTFPQTVQTQATGGSGGAGGSGGVGRGFNNPAAGSGASGSAGSPSTAGNGGAGGSGGAGGGYGQSGATGNTGSTGAPSTTSGTAGGSGGSGGAAGLAVEKAAPISFTFTNNGTVSGTVQS
tara:strand:- start:4950 stop:6203 length:1254 start_codon:yes stop_codon:yes gene_type:complete